MMTREEAIDIIENKIQIDVRLCTKEEVEQYQEALTMALTVLRPVSREQELEAENKELKERIVNWRKYMTPTREQVEKVWRGEWEYPGYYDDGGSFVHDCSKCNTPSTDEYWFCPFCGAPMTDEAVEMVMKRMEELYGE